MVHDTAEASDQAVGRGGGALGCTQTLPLLGGGDHSPAGPCCDSSLHCVVGGGRRGDTASMKPARGALSCFPFRMNVLLSSVSFNIRGPSESTQAP